MPVEPQSVALTTDLYELTMSAAYYQQGMTGKATFEMFVRNMPENRGYLITAGLEHVLDYLEALRFTEDDLWYLFDLPVFTDIDEGFWDYLRALRFEGDVWAIPEGTVVTEDEPLLRVTAPLIHAQIIEAYLLSVMNFQTMIATKAARVVDAADGRGVQGRGARTASGVVDFGLRRAHGTEAGFWAARACFIGGCVGTSNVDAARAFGIPPIGTAAHSFTLAFDSEERAFDAYAASFPDNVLLLIDTYDTTEGARKAARFGDKLQGVRIDSGDLLRESRKVRKILDKAGCEHAKIVASSNLNEYKIEALVKKGAPIDLFGVGTEMITSADAPALPGVYKLVSIERDGVNEPCAKQSEGKAMYPGAKQVYRVTKDGLFSHDLLATDTEAAPEGAVPLLEKVMEGGSRIGRKPHLDIIRDRAMKQRQQLAPNITRLSSPHVYPVEATEELERLARQTAAKTL